MGEIMVPNVCFQGHSRRTTAMLDGLSTRKDWSPFLHSKPFIIA